MNSQNSADKNPESIRISVDRNAGPYTLHLLSEFVKAADSAREIASQICPDKEYVINIPNYIRDGLTSEKYSFMQKSETGEFLATIMETNPEGKKKILTNLTLREDIPAEVMPQHLRSLSEGLSNMALMQQYQQISRKLDMIQKRIDQIQNYQKFECFGKIIGARKMLWNASQDYGLDRTIAIGNAILSLNEAIGMLELVLKDKVDNFQSIPATEFGIWIKMLSLMSGDYSDDRDNDYNEIKEYILAYTCAHSLLACAYRLEDRPDKIKKVMNDCTGFLEDLADSNIRSIQNLYRRSLDSFSEEWFRQPDTFVERHFNPCLVLEHCSFEKIEVSLTGKQLIEVLKNDKS